MPFSFQDRVEDYTGSVSDTGALSDWLIAGARRLIDLFPPGKLIRFAKPITCNPAQEVDISNERVLYVTAGGIPVLPISDPANYLKYTLATSLHFAPATDPRYMFSAGKIKILPISIGGVVNTVPYPRDPFFHLSEIPNFPVEAEELVVLYAAIQVEGKKLSSIVTSMASLTITPPTSPTPPSFTLAELTSIFDMPVLSLTDALGATSGIAHVLDSEQDLELTQGKLGHIDRLIGEYQAKVEGEAALANDGINIYKTNLDRYQADIGKYSQDISKYQADLQVQVQTYGANVQQYGQQVQALVASIRNLSEQYYSGLQLILRGGLPGDNKAAS